MHGTRRLQFCPDWVAKLFSSFWAEQQTFLFSLTFNFEMFVSPPPQYFTLKAISHSWDLVISKVFISFFLECAFAPGIHTGERQNDKRWERVYFKARSRSQSHDGGSPCLLKLAGLLAAKSQWFGCVGRSKVMFKVSKCSLFRVRLRHWLCDLWFYKPSSQARLMRAFSSLLLPVPSPNPRFWSSE